MNFTKFTKYIGTLGLLSTGYIFKEDFKFAYASVSRYTNTASTVALILADYKYSLWNIDKTSELYQLETSKVHTRSALRLRKLCHKNGGCYIKVGQHLGSLDLILPREYVQVMKALHKESPKSDYRDVENVIKEDFGKDVSELFKTFEKEPIASASLAQVHRVTLLTDGMLVAVKVQHKVVEANSKVDMATMDFFFVLISWAFPDFRFRWLAEETRRNIPMELDFVHESENCRMADRMFSSFDFVKIPKVYNEYTSKRVLTMEFCEGIYINDRERLEKNGISIKKMMDYLGRLYSEMIFVRGYIHCDPHPGNILVQRNEVNGQIVIVLLDHGLYQILPEEIRMNYCHLWQSILRVDKVGIKNYSLNLGIRENLYPMFACMLAGRSWESIERGIDKKDFSSTEENLIRSTVTSFLSQIADILQSVPRPLLLVFKTNDVIRGLEATLKCRSDAGSFITMMRSCLWATYHDEIKKCNKNFCRFYQFILLTWLLTKLSIYSFHLRIQSAMNNRMERRSFSDERENF